MFSFTFLQVKSHIGKAIILIND